MNPTFWLETWQNNDIPFHLDTPTVDLISHLHHLKIRQREAIFVPLCGKTPDMLYLAKQGYEVIGAELSTIACTQFFSEQGIVPTITDHGHYQRFHHQNITLYCGDLFAMNREDFPSVSAIYDNKALIALPIETREPYVQQLIACFGTHLSMLLLTRESPCPVQPPPYPIDERTIRHLYQEHFTVQCLQNRRVEPIPSHLQQKGYSEIHAGVYLITP